MIAKGTLVRCSLESRGRVVEIEGRVVQMHGSRFADVAIGLGGTTVTLPVGDLETVSADVIDFASRRRRTVDVEDFDRSPMVPA